MTKQEFDNHGFFFGIKGKVNGNWYPLSTCDFRDKTITIVIDEGEEVVIPCLAIEELEKCSD